jgi:hypothetical protein
MIRPERAPYSPQFQRLAAVHKQPKRALGLCVLRRLLQRLADLALYIARVFKALYYPINQILKYAGLTVPVRAFAVQRR